MQSKATTVNGYLKSLPGDRREAIQAIRQVILNNLHEGFEEMMTFGMIGYGIPLERFPNTYNGQPFGVAGLASQKNYMSVYLMNVYGDPATLAWFLKEYKASGRRLDMGKSCVRFRRLDDLPLDLIGRAIARTSVEDMIAVYGRLHPRKE